MFEQRKKPLLPRRAFYLRVARSFALALAITLVSLSIGMAGYHGFEGLSWLDAFLNAAMILAGMGPVGTLNSDAAKLFASAYALFSGVVFISVTGILLSPMFHLVLHRFHIEQRDSR